MPMEDIYNKETALLWSGNNPFLHASGIWGRPKLLNLLEKDLNKDAYVADFGCGSGRVTSIIAGMLTSKGKVLGLDNNEALIDVAIKNEQLLGNIDFNKVDVSKETPFLENKFDFVVSFMLLQNLNKSELKNTINEAARVLKPDGKMAHLTLHSDFFKYDWDLDFIRYDKEQISTWRLTQSEDLRINGTLVDTLGREKPCMAYPHTREDIFSMQVDGGFVEVKETPIHIDYEEAVYHFGKESIKQFPPCPLFSIWISRLYAEPSSRVA